ncbi:aminodeoxychorismate synthase component I [Paraconexibacter sp.]|uniref:aminodeoxychorismate synthase component I n=1 Tax=Paraconexibacter sp. TaxID=2949640 RepID=UPI0035661CBC
MSAAVPTVATLIREPLGVPLATWRAPLLLRGEACGTALLGDWADGSRAIVTGAPLVVLRPTEDPFAAVERLPTLAPAHPPRAATPPAPHAPAPPGADLAGAVGGGWFGRFGYPLGRRLEPVGGPPPRPCALPDASLAFHDHLVRQDAEGTWWLEALWTDRRDAELRDRFEELRALALALETEAAQPQQVVTGPWDAHPSASAHAAAVEACVERIAAGDLFQANLCQRLESRTEGDLLELFTAAWRSLTPAKAAFCRGHWGSVASLSPELYLRRDGRTVVSSPIKGTRSRGPDEVADHEARQELLGSEKDRAEHVMIVDLVRNDLGRVCEAGSVRVPALAVPRPAPGVWHLVSDVKGTLRDGVGDGELLHATFPPGSVTGAPKIAAMRVIHELESTGRETYTGAIGMVSPAGGLDLNVAIRTFEAAGGRIWLGVGGGIVADSTGQDEAREAADKAAPLLAAIGAPPFVRGASGSAAIPPPRPVPPRRGPVPLPRPEPERGVFETLLVVGGEPQHVEAHVARLTDSTVALWDDAIALRPLLARMHAAITAAGSDREPRARLRVDVRPGAAGRLEVRAVCSPLPPATPSPVALVPVVVPGGFGAHKWSDRRLWDALAPSRPDALALAVDLDGFVLETSRANVFVVLADGSVATPPLDGRILPGTTRGRELERLRTAGVCVVERAIALEEVADAPEIRLTGALRGVERAVLCEPRPGPLAVRAN